MVARSNSPVRAGVAVLVLLTTVATSHAAPARPAAAAPNPVPPSPYLPLIYRYADTMLERGRDTFGPHQTGLLLSALDRATLAPLEGRPAAPAGVPESWRAGPAEAQKPLAGSNPQHDQNLLRVLYTLSELSAKPVYRDAADAELTWLLDNPTAADPPLAFWDAGGAWDVLSDAPVPGDADVAAGFSRPWVLWDRCFELAPEASLRLVSGLRRAAADGAEAASPRRSGFAVRAFAAAYRHTKDEALLQAIEAELETLEAGQKGGPGPAGEPARGREDASAAAWLSAAIDCSGAAGRVPEPLAGRLRAFAARVDDAFCALPHDLEAAGGFALWADAPGRKSDGALTPLWQSDRAARTTAMVAMMCVSRYENTADVRYREIIRAAADAYRNALPADDGAAHDGEAAAAWPMTYGHAISLQLAAWRSTARREYLDCATALADRAVRRFWGDSPLPAAGAGATHYETVTGADTLALSLVELHLSILHITAVRCPPNTIDR